MAKPMYYWNGTTWEAVAPVVPQSPIAYQASAPSSPSTGDLWIDSDQDLDSYQRQLVRYRFNPSAGATSVSGVDANGATLSYTPGAEQVYLNGALLVRGSDYVATNGTSITSLAALSSGDVLEVFAYVAFNPANTYTQSQVDGLVAPMGLVHLNTTNFSAVSSISLPQGTFTTTYDDYKVIFRLTATSAGGVVTLRTRTTGTDVTSADYYFGGNRQYTNVTTFSAYSGNAATSITVAPISGSAYFTLNLDIFRPMLAVNTAFTGQGFNTDGTNTALTIGALEGTTGLRDSLSFICSTGNFTGSVAVYGYRK